MKYKMNANFLAFASVILNAIARSEVLPGGWKDNKVDAESESRLMRVLTSASTSSNVLVPSMCINKVVSVKSQVVAGMSYEYKIEGCNAESDLGLQKCVTCEKPKVYVVLVYERVWEHAEELISISEEPDDLTNKSADSGQESESAHMEPETNGINDEEKAQIADWVSQNKLNRYGDQDGTSYAGGNPLFDENAGKFIDYYDYMLDKFPTRPWRHTVVRAQSSVSNDSLQFMAETEGKNKWTFGVSAILVASVFGAVVAMVMVFRTQRTQRRHAYASISG